MSARSLFPSRILLCVALLAALGAGLGCQGGGKATDGGAPTVSAPSALVATTGTQLRTLTLSWQPSAGTVDGYWLEGAWPGEAFQALNYDILPPDAHSTTIPLSNPQEGQILSFRVRAAQGANFSAYSETTALPWVDAPTFSYSEFNSAGVGAKVSWDPGATKLADQIKIERTLVDAMGQPTDAWVTIGSFPCTQGSCIDTSVQETKTYLYRATNLVQGIARTASVLSGTISIPLFPPTEFKATPQGTGMLLTWRNNSPSAIKINVSGGFYAPGNLLATLPPGTTSYLDPAPPLGTCTYQLTVEDQGSLKIGYSDKVFGTASTPAPLVLTSDQIPVTRGYAFQGEFSPQGTWALAVSGPRILSADNSWPANLLSKITAMARDSSRLKAFQLDSLGYPHAVYSVPSTADTLKQTLMHAWFDGTLWQTEDMTTGYVSNGLDPISFTFCLDSHGLPRVLVKKTSGSAAEATSTGNLYYLTKTATTWDLEPLAGGGAQLSDLALFTLALDGQDEPHVILSDSSSIYEAIRTTDGTWTTSSLPGATISPDPNRRHFLASSWSDGTSGWLFYPHTDSSSQVSLMAMEKVAGVWQAPAQVIPMSTLDDYTPTSFLTARSQDRSRILVATNTDGAFVLLNRIGQEWNITLIPQTHFQEPLCGLAFDAAGHAHLLTGFQYDVTDWHE